LKTNITKKKNTIIKNTLNCTSNTLNRVLKIIRTNLLKTILMNKKKILAAVSTKNKKTILQLRKLKQTQITFSQLKFTKILKLILHQKRDNTTKRVKKFTMTRSQTKLVRVRKTRLIRMNELKSRKKRHKFMTATTKTDTFWLR
jgi:hypothetical protein